MSLTKAHYAALLVPLCAQIVAAVRDDGPDALRELLDAARSINNPASVDPNDAIIAIIAAMVDPNRTTKQLLHWTRGDGRLRARTRMRERQYRPLMVARCLARRVSAVDLNLIEQEHVVRVLHEQGCSEREIAYRIAASRHVVRRCRIRMGLPVHETQAA